MSFARQFDTQHFFPPPFLPVGLGIGFGAGFGLLDLAISHLQWFPSPQRLLVRAGARLVGRMHVMGWEWIVAGASRELDFFMALFPLPCQGPSDFILADSLMIIGQGVEHAGNSALRGVSISPAVAYPNADAVRVQRLSSVK